MKVLGHDVFPPIVLLVTAEFVVATLAFMVAASALPNGGSLVGPPRAGLPWGFGFAFAVVIGITVVGLYQAKQRFWVKAVLTRLVVGVGVAALSLAAIDAVFLGGMGISGPRWLFTFVLALVPLGVTRSFFTSWFDHKTFQRSVVVYGAGARARSLFELRRRSDWRGFKVVAFVTNMRDSTVLKDDRVVYLNGPLLDYAKTHEVSEIVVAMDDRRGAFPERELLKCKFAGIRVVEMLDFLERETGKLKVNLANPSWLIFADGFERPKALTIATRVLDLTVAATLLVLTAPLTCIVALAIVLDDGLPVLYRQQRVGQYGKAFTLLKFRSMVRDAEAGGKAIWAAATDSRVTRVGRILRKLRLDELPQLINVLRGEMSLVGPRPERPEFVEKLAAKIPYYHERHLVKPGITGWAQVKYPYGCSDHDAMEKLSYDLYYIKYKSFLFDLLVLLQTAEVVLWQKGAR